MDSVETPEQNEDILNLFKADLLQCIDDGDRKYKELMDTLLATKQPLKLSQLLHYHITNVVVITSGLTISYDSENPIENSTINQNIQNAILEARQKLEESLNQQFYQFYLTKHELDIENVAEMVKGFTLQALMSYDQSAEQFSASGKSRGDIILAHERWEEGALKMFHQRLEMNLLDLEEFWNRGLNIGLEQRLQDMLEGWATENTSYRRMHESADETQVKGAATEPTVTVVSPNTCQIAFVKVAEETQNSNTDEGSAIQTVNIAETTTDEPGHIPETPTVEPGNIAEAPKINRGNISQAPAAPEETTKTLPVNASNKPKLFRRQSLIPIVNALATGKHGPRTTADTKGLNSKVPRPQIKPQIVTKTSTGPTNTKKLAASSITSTSITAKKLAVATKSTTSNANKVASSGTTTAASNKPPVYNRQGSTGPYIKKTSGIEDLTKLSTLDIASKAAPKPKVVNITSSKPTTKGTTGATSTVSKPGNTAAKATVNAKSESSSKVEIKSRNSVVPNSKPIPKKPSVATPRLPGSSNKDSSKDHNVNPTARRTTNSSKNTKTSTMVSTSAPATRTSTKDTFRAPALPRKPATGASIQANAKNTIIKNTAKGKSAPAPVPVSERNTEETINVGIGNRKTSLDLTCDDTESIASTCTEITVSTESIIFAGARRSSIASVQPLETGTVDVDTTTNNREEAIGPNEPQEEKAAKEITDLKEVPSETVVSVQDNN